MNERAAAQQQDYAIRLERVVTWLAGHLDAELDLTRLAEVACMSPFHFHRIYHAMQGETAADTVRRLRLHRSAVELIAGEQPVVRIARRAGYGSQEAFTRAFKAAYGVPPARYRSAFVGAPAVREDRVEHHGYQATTRDIPRLRVASLAHHGDYQTIGVTFQRLATIIAGQGLFGPATRSFGIYYDDAAVTPHGELRAEACLSVPDDWTPSDGLDVRDVGGGRYAITEHVGPYAELERPYRWLYGTWLPKSGEEGADAPCVEAYLNDARTVPPHELRTEIWLPLR